MPVFWVEFELEAHVKLSKRINANTADDARRIFVNRIGKWESTAERLQPECSITHPVFPNTDYSGDDIHIEVET